MKSLQVLLQQQFNKMCATGKLFTSSISGSKIWEVYLNYFPQGMNPKFRDPASSVHNCQNCNNFIRRYGNIVAIDETGVIMTIYSALDNLSLEDFEEYGDSLEAMHGLLLNAPIQDVFFETFNELNSLPYESTKKTQEVFRLGISKNVKRYTPQEAATFGVVKAGETRTFHHFHLDLPKQFVDMSGKSIESIKAFYRDKYSVFKRALQEIPLDTLYLVRDLINQGSLLDGETHLHSVEEMADQKNRYELCKNSETIDNWFWKHSYEIEERTAKFKNTLIGVLCTELAEGEELNKACQNWNKRVDPANYMKAVAPITEQQKKMAQQFVEENDYVSAFDRRLATIDDIKVNEILHSNVGDGSIKPVSLFDNVKTSSSRHKRNEFKGVEEVSIEKVMKNILPECSSVEIFLENKQENNLVTLTTSNDENARQIFKWSNPYSWTYNGNLAGKSMIEEAINKRGGKTDGVFNVRLHFPKSTADYDLIITEPNGNTINYHKRRQVQLSSGTLDLDAQGVDGDFPPEKRVENINYTHLTSMPKGEYIIAIKNYGGGSDNGFLMEIKSPEGLSKYQCNNILGSGTTAFIIVNFDGTNFTSKIINNKIVLVDSEHVSKEIYGLETQKFHKVNLVCLSPNHWGENNVGNKHYFFMLDGCKVEKSIRSFHSENLLPELAQHRKVLEVLGAVNMLEPSDNQLSGLGFNATVRDEVILRLKGNFKRVIKVKF